MNQKITRIDLASSHATPLSVLKTYTDKRPPKFLDILHTDSISEAGVFELLEQLPENGLSVIGTRYPQRRSIELMEKTFARLKGSNKIILSGFARGIDSRAHELALENGLKTIAFIGCGINIDYPRENRHLKKKIIEAGGLVISEFEKDLDVYPGNFIQRNRLIAAFSKATWVVEGAAISGTLNTAAWAFQFGRDVYATPCFPGDSFFQGNEKLLSEAKPDSVPIAHPFFDTRSLAPTWPEFYDSEKQIQFNFQQALQSKTAIQRWVFELKEAHGICHLQSLMNHACRNGYQPGQFYTEFEAEIGKGFIHHHPDGSVSCGP